MMPDLAPEAVKLLWPMLQVLGAIAAGIGGLAAGFRWLRGQIRDVAGELVEPLSAKVVLAQQSADAAHRRLDDLYGKTRFEPDPDPDSTASRRLRGGV